MFAGAVIVGIAAGLTAIIRLCVIILPHRSVNVHVSVTVPPQEPGAAVCVDKIEPLIRHVPEPPALTLL
jgi:hypothetical protein